jgi:excisionase family DNA binding protein
VLTVKAVAERAAVSSALVYDWIASGRLIHYRMGRSSSKRGGIRVSENDLEAFLMTLRQGGEPRERKPSAPRPSKRKFKHLYVR